MEGRLYLIFLILSAIFPAEINASNNKLFDTHLIRKKRLIDHSGHQNSINSISLVPYIVNILANEKHICAGIILSPIDILTAAHCVNKNHMYTILSNSANIKSGIRHNITNVKIHEDYDDETSKHDLALISISPAIDFVRSDNRPIQLHRAESVITSVPVVSGWGCIRHTSSGELVFPEQLQSVAIPIINERLCKNLYPIDAKYIDDTHICVRDPHGLKTSCHGDSGDPLVANNHLLGIMVWSSKNPNPTFPDVFLKVYHHTYSHWIKNNMHHRA